MSAHNITVNSYGKKLTYDEDGKPGKIAYGKSKDKFRWSTNGYHLEVKFDPADGPFDTPPGPVTNAHPGNSASDAFVTAVRTGCYKYTATLIPAQGDQPQSEDPQVIIDGGAFASTFLTVFAGVAVAALAVIIGLNLLDRERK